MSLLFNPLGGCIHQALFYALVVFVKMWVYIRKVKIKNDIPMTDNLISGI
jgi:hypothetical protein